MSRSAMASHSAGRELLEDDELFHQLMEQAADALFVAEADGRLIEVNRHACESIGLTRAEILKGSIFDLDPDLDQSEARTFLAIVDREGQLTVERRMRRADGSTFPVEMRLSRIRLGGVRHVLGAARDITDRKRSEDALRSSEQNLRSVFVNLIDVFYRVDLEGRILMITPSVERYGYDSKQMVGRSVLEFYDSPLDRARLLRKLVEDGSISDVEITLKHADGSPIPVSASARVMFDDRGEAVGTEGLLRNATERKRSREELEASRSRLRALSNRLLEVQEEERRRIAREVHDELGQALTALSLDTSWLARHIENDRLAQEKLAKIAAILDMTMVAVQRISRELRPLLLDDLGLAAALQWLVREFQERTGIICVLEVSKTVSLSKERATALFRVVQEALTNVARHANARHVKIQLLRLPKDLVRLLIEDDGRGIHRDEVENPQSFGLLGMHERLRMCEGTLVIEQRAECGTRLEAVLPSRRRRAARSKDAA